MFQIGGELGIKVMKINPDRDIVRPYNGIGVKSMMDLSLYGDDNHWLHLCGDNDWGYLALEILKPILQEANRLYYKISNNINSHKPEVVLVGRNEFRMLDILHAARDGEEGISVIMGVPIVKGNFDNGIKYLGKKTEDDSELSFK